ncbi:MAG TPA: DUF3843 family protein [Chthoniobacterales bacterium]
MIGAPIFRDQVQSCRPPGAPPRETKALFLTASRFRDQLDDCLDAIESDAFLLNEDDLDELAIALTELAEDLHCNAGLWRSIETYHREFFGVSLPLLCKSGDPALKRFDARRFQFFLYTVWRHFKPEHIVSPGHKGFRAIAQYASEYFSKAFAAHPHRSAVTAFLAKPNRRGWDVKRKLVWLGTRSFLFRFAFQDYLRKQEAKPGEEIAVTDDFLCQHCTEWSGLGTLDILAAALELPDTDRAVLRGWYERHAAFYRIESLHIRGSEVETFDAVNLINDQTYRVRIEIARDACMFHSGQMVYGSLVPWRGEWYWSGTQQTWKSPPKDFASVKREFREKHSSIAYRYCPDLAQQAREIAAEHFADFQQFHGSDLAVFPDGLSAAAAEQKRMRVFSEIKAGKDLEKILKKFGLKRPAQAGLPRKLIESGNGVAVFYQEGEGTEMLTGYGTLLSTLKKGSDPLSQTEMEILQAFIEEDAISPAFVRRVIRDAGSSAIARLYFLTDCAEGIEYLLRRFKGCFYRKRHPCISLRDE